MTLRAALILAAGAAAAAEPPRYFSAPAHPLTVRDQPAGKPIGALPPGAAPIEVSAADARQAWVRIGLGEVDGWVALDALTPVDPPMLSYAPFPDGLTCAGVEPFWALSFSSEGATWSAPDVAPRVAAGLTSAAADGRDWPVMLHFDGLTAVIRPAACSDGMSDRTDPWIVDVIMDRSLRTGCCRLPRPQ
jgi:hypothetical protein